VKKLLVVWIFGGIRGVFVVGFMMLGACLCISFLPSRDGGVLG